MWIEDSDPVEIRCLDLTLAERGEGTASSTYRASGVVGIR